MVNLLHITNIYNMFLDVSQR